MNEKEESWDQRIKSISRVAADQAERMVRELRLKAIDGTFPSGADESQDGEDLPSHE